MRGRKKIKDISEKQKVFESLEYQKFIRENNTEKDDLNSTPSKLPRISKKSGNVQVNKEPFVPGNHTDNLIDDGDSKIQSSLDLPIPNLSEIPVIKKKQVVKKTKKNSVKDLHFQEDAQGILPSLEDIPKEESVTYGDPNQNSLSSETFASSNLSKKTRKVPVDRLDNKSEYLEADQIHSNKKAHKKNVQVSNKKRVSKKNFEENLSIGSDQSADVDENVSISVGDAQYTLDDKFESNHPSNNVQVPISKNTANSNFLKLKIHLPSNLIKEIKRTKETPNEHTNIENTPENHNLAGSPVDDDQFVVKNETEIAKSIHDTPMNYENKPIQKGAHESVYSRSKFESIDHLNFLNDATYDLKNEDNTRDIQVMNFIPELVPENQIYLDPVYQVTSTATELPPFELSSVHKTDDNTHILPDQDEIQKSVGISDTDNTSGSTNQNESSSSLTIMKNIIPEPVIVDENAIYDNLDNTHENSSDLTTMKNIIPEPTPVEENVVSVDLAFENQIEETSKSNQSTYEHQDSETSELRESSVLLSTNDKAIQPDNEILTNNTVGSSTPDQGSESSISFEIQSHFEDQNVELESESSSLSEVPEVVQSYYSDSFFSDSTDSVYESDTSFSFGSFQSNDSDENTVLETGLEPNTSCLNTSEDETSSSSLEFPHFETTEIVNWQQILPIINFLSQRTEFFELKDALKPLKEEILKKEPAKPKKIVESPSYLDTRYLYFLKKVCFLGKNEAVFYCKDQNKLLIDRGNKNKATLLPPRSYSALDSDNDVKIYITEEVKKSKKQSSADSQVKSESIVVSLQKLTQINDVKIPDYNKETFEYLVFKHGENMESISKEANMSIKDVILVYYLKYHNVTLEISGALLDKYVEEEWSMRDRILFEENFMKYNTKFHKYMINKSEDDLRIYYRFYLKNYIPMNWTDEERTLFAHLFGTYKKDWPSMEKCFPNKTAQDLKVFYCSYFKKLDEEERNREAKLVEMDLPPIVQKKRGRKPNALKLLENETEDRDE